VLGAARAGASRDAQNAAATALYALGRLVQHDTGLGRDDELLQDAVVHVWCAWSRRGGARCDRSAWSWAYAALHRRMLNLLRYRSVRTRYGATLDEAHGRPGGDAEAQVVELVGFLRGEIAPSGVE
jgi:DNA-directed RNA polymerase specialized sigma24 family protein